MFQSEQLKNYFESSFSVSAKSAVIAEWNMNIPGNILKIGNYRYRPTKNSFNALPNFFDKFDVGNFYTNATYGDISVQQGFEEDNTTPLVFTYLNEKEKIYYSLEDCFKPFRPRSGINKASFFNNKYTSFPNEDMYLRPRYYMPHRDDEFKYWRSYRKESVALESGYVEITSNEIPISVPLSQTNIEYGISSNSSNGIYKIEDAVPFVVYNESVPANRIIVKVQTNIGNIDLGPFKTSSLSNLSDPFFGDSNKTVPQQFNIQYLDENDQWKDAYVFDQTSLRNDESAIFKSDGYLSIEYGLEIPIEYKDNFILVKNILSENELPSNATTGTAYLLKTQQEDRGVLYIYNGSEFISFIPQYSWSIGTDGTYENTHFVTDFTNPDYFKEVNNDIKIYREFVWIKGIRLVVKSMNTPETPLELIELSPRLISNLTEQLIGFELEKTLSDMATTALPVGRLISSVGSISLFDNDQAFNINNSWNGESGSIIAKYIQKNVKFVIYEVIENVDNVNYYIPLKSLYSEGIPQVDQSTSTISIQLKDFYFYLESTPAPSIFITEVSLSEAVCLLLDSIGFSNYIFKRLDTESDPVVPFFFISPNQNVAEVLNQLAISTQSAMFFDEYNNFVVMTKEYLMNDNNSREVDFTLYGSNNQSKEGINKNITNGPITNIIAIASQDQKVYNSGSINYTERYIQRTYGSFQQSQYVDKTWIYKPVLLWEVSGTESTKTLNSEKQEKYALGAMPLNSDLTDQLPRVVSRQIINNTLDVGENAYWITRFQGFLYSAGEIIKYDAVEYSVTGLGNVWITNNKEYQKYFSKLPFNGKIYPTGLIRIYCEPYYENINGITKLKNGEVVSHGRGQFGTKVTYHNAGLDEYWTNNSNVQGCQMESQYLFSTQLQEDLITTLPSTTSGAAGLNQPKAQKSKRNGITKNFISSGYSTETDVGLLKTTKTGTVQSSAFIINGPDFEQTEKPIDFITYVHKPITGAYKHFGTRMRIIGKIESSGDRSQTPVGSMTYFNVPSIDPTQTVSIGGGSGGISLVNPITNNGYYFEISALTAGNLESYLRPNAQNESAIAIDNIMFYKILKESSSSNAIPIKMWGGNGNILVDDGNFIGQYRFVGEENPTVYDLSIEYVDINNNLRIWYLYINQKLIKTIEDTSPIPLVSTNVGLFVRGTSRLMFENVYMLSKNYAENAAYDLDTPIASVFGDDNNQINATEALTKYAISGVIQKTFLTGISPTVVKEYNIDFEEFGTIMRECAYFNIKYDRAYPALYATIAPTFTRLRGYTVSGFTADSYGAEFLIFNNTDTILNLDETTGNYLRIIGVSFTQDTTNTITVDDYYKKRGNLSDPELAGDVIIRSPYQFIEEYNQIKQSRVQYGKNEFSIDSVYIQDRDTAENLLGWLVQKHLTPKKAVGINIFPTPTIQLGDIVTINYKTDDGIDVVSNESTKFIVYNISYSKNADGPNMTLHLSEV
jgi:hypothetical protein